MTKINQQVIEKAVMNLGVLANGGLLNAEQSDEFIRRIIDQPTIMRESRTVKMASDSRKIEKIGFGQRLLHRATEGLALDSSKHAAPTTGTITLNAKEFIAVVKITDDSLENNIEGNKLEDTIMDMLAAGVSLDLEELALNGDTASSDPYLTPLDGLRKIIQTNVIDAASGTDYKNYFKQAKKAVPSRYLRNPLEWRHYTSHNLETEWVDLVGQRQTTAGDSSLLQGTVKPAFGIPVRGIAMLQDYSDGAATPAMVSDSILIHPKNIIVGISRDFHMELERSARERSTYIVLTVKVDLKVEEEEAACKTVKIKA